MGSVLKYWTNYGLVWSSSALLSPLYISLDGGGNHHFMDTEPSLLFHTIHHLHFSAIALIPRGKWNAEKNVKLWSELTGDKWQGEAAVVTPQTLRHWYARNSTHSHSCVSLLLGWIRDFEQSHALVSLPSGKYFTVRDSQMSDRGVTSSRKLFKGQFFSVLHLRCLK